MTNKLDMYSIYRALIKDTKSMKQMIKYIAQNKSDMFDRHTFTKNIKIQNSEIITDYLKFLHESHILINRLPAYGTQEYYLDPLFANSSWLDIYRYLTASKNSEILSPEQKIIYGKSILGRMILHWLR